MSHLLAISIGPVQGFIAAARKTRDLWYGSRMLSDTARAVATYLRDDAGAELIFPHPDALDGEATIANKVLAITDADPHAIYTAARKAAQDYLNECEKRLWETLRHPDAVDGSLIRAQVNEFLEMYGAWVTYDPQRYTECREEVDRLLDGRKALRDFKQPGGDFATSRDGRPKSTLNPALESVLIPGKYAAVRDALRLKGGEQLDGVSLIKRRLSDERFVSTSRVALDPIIRRLEESEETKRLLRDLNDRAEKLFGMRCPAVERIDTKRDRLAHFAAFPYDCQLWYDEEGHDPDMEARPEAERMEAKEFTEAARKACRRVGMGEPPAYYAILVADGDRMGRVIGQMETPNAHQQLSAALADFARQAAEIVAEHSGALVYSGGDDVLAFLPLPNALTCADALRHAFYDRLKGFEKPGEGKDAITVSLSIGVAIVHYIEPLYEALEWARAAEHAAKVPRNALAVALHTRSSGGNGLTVTHAWKENPVSNRWEFWTQCHREKAIPDGFAYELRRLTDEFRAVPDVLVTHSDLLAREVRRIRSRKRAASGMESLDSQVVARIETYLTATTHPLEPDTLINTMQTLIGDLLITRRLAAAQEREAIV